MQHTDIFGYKNNTSILVTKIYSDICWEGCATRILYGPIVIGVSTNNRSGRGSRPCRLWTCLDNALYIVLTALIVRVQCFRDSLFKVLEEPSTAPILHSVVTGSLCRCRIRLTVFEPEEMKFDICTIWLP